MTVPSKSRSPPPLHDIDFILVVLGRWITSIPNCPTRRSLQSTTCSRFPDSRACSYSEDTSVRSTNSSDSPRPSAPCHRRRESGRSGSYRPLPYAPLDGAQEALRERPCHPLTPVPALGPECRMRPRVRRSSRNPVGHGLPSPWVFKKRPSTGHASPRTDPRRIYSNSLRKTCS